MSDTPDPAVASVEERVASLEEQVKAAEGERDAAMAKLAAEPEPEPEPEPTGTVTVINTSGYPLASLLPGQTERLSFPRGVTHGVPAATWAAWLKAHGTSELVANNLVTATAED